MDHLGRPVRNRKSKLAIRIRSMIPDHGNDRSLHQRLHQLSYQSTNALDLINEQLATNINNLAVRVRIGNDAAASDSSRCHMRTTIAQAEGRMGHHEMENN